MPSGNEAQPACCEYPLQHDEPAANREFAAGSATLGVPAAGIQVTKDEHAAAVLENQLEVTATHLSVGPPAVPAEPVLQHGLDRRAPERRREAVGAHLDAHLPRTIQALGAGHRRSSGNGARTARRSGSRESGSTSSTRISASCPTARRTCRTASPSRARRTSPGSLTSACWSWAGGPNASTSIASDSAGAGRSTNRGA